MCLYLYHGFFELSNGIAVLCRQSITARLESVTALPLQAHSAFTLKSRNSLKLKSLNCYWPTEHTHTFSFC